MSNSCSAIDPGQVVDFLAFEIGSSSFERWGETVFDRSSLIAETALAAQRLPIKTSPKAAS
jgi:hypothetical protein